MKPNIELGDKVKDIITGFTGIVQVTEIWRNGNTKAQVQSKELKDGKPLPGVIFDYEELEVVTKKIVKATPVKYKGPVKLGDLVRDNAGYEGYVEVIRTSLSGCIQFGIYARKLTKKGEHVKGVLDHSDDVYLIEASEEPLKEGTGATKMGYYAR